MDGRREGGTDGRAGALRDARTHLQTAFRIHQSLNTAIDGAALVSPLAVEELPAADEEFGPSIHSEVEANEGSKGPRADSDFAKIILSGHAAIRKERKASDMMHLSWDQNLAGMNIVIIVMTCYCWPEIRNGPIPFLVATKLLYKSVCQSVRPISVRLSLFGLLGTTYAAHTDFFCSNYCKSDQSTR